MFSRLFGRKRAPSSPKEPAQALIGKEQLPANVASWTQQQVVSWLTQNEMKEYADSFAKNAISGSELVELTESEIESLGVKKIGCRKRILKLILENSRKSRDIHTPLTPSGNISLSIPDRDELSESSDIASSLSTTSSSLRRLSSQFKIAVPASLPSNLDERYALFEDLPDGVIVMGLDKSIMYVNKCTERIFLYKREELLGCNIKILMSEPHRSKHDGYVDKYLVTGERHIIGKGRMVEAKAKDNSLVPIWLSVTETEDDTGTKIFMGSFKDLRSINPTSKSTQNKMLLLLDNLVDAAIVMNTDSQIMFFNKSAEVFFGYSKEEIIGQPIETIIPPDVAPKHKTFVSNYMKSHVGKVIGKGRMVEVLKKDGTIQSVFFSLTETKWGEGNTTAFCATLQPSTEIMEAKKTAAQNGPKKVEEEKRLDPNDPTTRLMQEVLDNHQARTHFKQFLASIKCMEPMLFVEAVDEYKNLKSNLYRYNTGKVIYENFIKVDSPQELNLPSAVRQDLLSQFVESKVTTSHCPVTIFGRAYEMVLADMRNDSFARYIMTDQFKSLQSNPASAEWFTKQPQLVIPSGAAVQAQ